jgi:eukaryotic-like serine/threonine-protein kinase
MNYHGIAHGYAGVAYATMMWAQARGVPPPAELRNVLETLAAAAEPLERGARWPLTPANGHAHDEYWPGWCHGNAGYVFLWNLARVTFGDRPFAELADRAARLLDYRVGVCSLCCGRAGQAYAALNQYRSTGEERWRSLAVEIASAPSTPDAQAIDDKNPLSLYKGEIGLALLAAELEQPDRAAMPLFEFEPAAA